MSRINTFIHKANMLQITKKANQRNVPKINDIQKACNCTINRSTTTSNLHSGKNYCVYYLIVKKPLVISHFNHNRQISFYLEYLKYVVLIEESFWSVLYLIRKMIFSTALCNIGICTYFASQYNAILFSALHVVGLMQILYTTLLLGCWERENFAH